LIRASLKDVVDERLDDDASTQRFLALFRAIKMLQ
jgi:hypothetical protein